MPIMICHSRKYTHLRMLEYEVCLAYEEHEVDVLGPDEVRIQTARITAFLRHSLLDLLQQQAVIHHVPQAENCRG